MRADNGRERVSEEGMKRFLKRRGAKKAPSLSKGYLNGIDACRFNGLTEMSVAQVFRPNLGGNFKGVI